MQDEGTPARRIDAYDDGLAIHITLAQPATVAHVAAAWALLHEWLEAYGEQGVGYRNCGVNSKVGATHVALWADRIRHEGGDQAAVDAAYLVAARAPEVLPTESTEVTSADEAADEDMEERLGQSVFRVRPGGDALADLRAATAPWYNGGLRPSFLPLAVMGLLRFIARRHETEISGVSGVPGVAPSLVGGLGIMALTWASRHHLMKGQIAMGVVASSALLALGLVGQLQPSEVALIELLGYLAPMLGFLWMVSWIWRERNTRVT